MGDVAELGVIVSVSGAEEGAKKLDTFSMSAKGAADSSKQLTSARAQAEKDWAAISGPALPTAANNLKNVAVNATATGQSMGIFQRAMNAITSIMPGYNQQSSGLSLNLGHLAGAHGDVARSIHALHPLVGAMGAQLGGMSQFAMAARGGIAGLAVAVTGALIISLEKAGDTLENVKKSLQAFMGEGAGGRAFDQLKKGTDSSNSSLATYQSTLMEVQRAIERTSMGKTITALGGDQFEVGSIKLMGYGKNLSEIFATMSQLGQLTGKTAAQADKDATEFLGAWAKSGTLTEQSFRDLETRMPSVAKAITKGFGEIDFNAMEKRLAAAPEEIVKVLQKIAQVTGETMAKYLDLKPDVAQGWDRLTTSVGKLWEELGKSSGVKGTSSFLTDLSNKIKQVRDDVEKGGGIGDAIYKAFTPTTPGGGSFPEWMQSQNWPSLSDVWKGMNKDADKNATETADAIVKTVSGWIDTVKSKLPDWQAQLGDYKVEGAFFDAGENQAGDNLGKGISEWISKVRDMLPSWQGALDMFGGAFNSIVDMAQSAMNRVLGIVQSMMQTIRNAITSASNVNTSGADLTTGYAASQPGVSFTVPSADSTMNDPSLQGFATGGTFKVGGTGGSDTTPVHFMATPGEIVSVSPIGSGTMGSAFQVGGAGGTDSMRVAFMATPGQTVTITPPNLISPLGASGLNATVLPTHGADTTATAAGQPTLALGGKPILVSPAVTAAAIANSATTTNAAASSSASTANPYTMYPIGGTGEIKIKPWKGDPLGTQSGYASWKDIYGPMPYDASGGSSGPSDAYYQQYNVMGGGTSGGGGSTFSGNTSNQDYYNSSTNSSSPPLDQVDWASFAGDYQTGGSFRIGGGGAPDTKLIAMRLSPDEHVKVTPQNEQNARTLRSAQPITININGNVSPAAFLASEAQVRRAARRIFN